jgi:signal peptidase
MRAFRIVQNVVLGIIAVLGAASILFVAAILAFDLRPADVVSGSMRPTLPVGSVVLTSEEPAAHVRVGDIVQVPRGTDSTVVTHRVESIEKTDAGYALTLKGDANKTADPQPYVVTSVGLYRGHIPYLGYVAWWVRSYPVYTVLILLGLLVFTFWGRSRVTVRMPDGREIDGLTRREAERLVASLQHT